MTDLNFRFDWLNDLSDEHFHRGGLALEHEDFYARSGISPDSVSKWGWVFAGWAEKQPRKYRVHENPTSQRLVINAQVPQAAPDTFGLDLTDESSAGSSDPRA